MQLTTHHHASTVNNIGITAFCFQIQIYVNDTNDNPPVFDSANYELSISEATPVGTVIVTMAATDQDHDNQLMYTMETNSSE